MAPTLCGSAVVVPPSRRGRRAAASVLPAGGGSPRGRRRRCRRLTTGGCKGVDGRYCSSHIPPAGLCLANLCLTATAAATAVDHSLSAREGVTWPFVITSGRGEWQQRVGGHCRCVSAVARGRKCRAASGGYRGRGSKWERGRAGPYDSPSEMVTERSSCLNSQGRSGAFSARERPPPGVRRLYGDVEVKGKRRAEVRPPRRRCDDRLHPGRRWPPPTPQAPRHGSYYLQSRAPSFSLSQLGRSRKLSMRQCSSTMPAPSCFAVRRRSTFSACLEPPERASTPVRATQAHRGGFPDDAGGTYAGTRGPSWGLRKGGGNLIGDCRRHDKSTDDDRVLVPRQSVCAGVAARHEAPAAGSHRAGLGNASAFGTAAAEGGQCRPPRISTFSSAPRHHCHCRWRHYGCPLPPR